MFSGATTYNSDISKWDVSGVNGKYDTISTHTQQIRYMQGNKQTQASMTQRAPPGGVTPSGPGKGGLVGGALLQGP